MYSLVVTVQQVTALFNVSIRNCLKSSAEHCLAGQRISILLKAERVFSSLEGVAFTGTSRNAFRNVCVAGDIVSFLLR